MEKQDWLQQIILHVWPSLPENGFQCREEPFNRYLSTVQCWYGECSSMNNIREMWSCAFVIFQFSHVFPGQTCEIEGGLKFSFQVPGCATANDTDGLPSFFIIWKSFKLIILTLSSIWQLEAVLSRFYSLVSSLCTSSFVSRRDTYFNPSFPWSLWSSIIRIPWQEST